MNVLSTPPALVLVHGALTDASVWHPVIARLQRSGHEVHAPALPMRDLNSDVASLVAYLNRIDGPVVLVGHSYAGSVISHPALLETEVKALVFIAAFQPDEGEAAGALNEKFPGSLLTPENLEIGADAAGEDQVILRPDRFAAVYAADVAPEHTAVMAVSQRPIGVTALSDPLPGRPAWRSLPSWAIVSTADRSLPPSILRFMAERAGSEITEVEAAHAVPVSQPDTVVQVIEAAARSITSKQPIA